MIAWEEAVVADAADGVNGIQELSVELPDGTRAKAILYCDEHGRAEAGDRVLLNVTAVRKRLGSGGVHFVHAVLKSGERDPSGRFLTRGTNAEGAGHLMKLRYTSLQRAVLAAEEPDSPYHELFREVRPLDGMPVLIGELHSMLPAAVCWLVRSAAVRGGRPPRIVYIMSDGGALPLAFSRHAAALRRLGWICGTVTYGHAYGGDLETMNKYSALTAARHALAADIAIAAMGPGIAGTGTPLGHTGVETGEIAHAVRQLGGRPVLIPRVSFADVRDRHRGISHHLLAVLKHVVAFPVALPLPSSLTAEQKAVIERQFSAAGCGGGHRIDWVEGIDPAEVERALEAYHERVTSMGRGFAEDPAFFLSVCAAAEAAAEHL